ncbi:uncharacterized protein RHOBADRAFT_44098 [Rhodotorula graminis WP1]|uniref:Enoyl reductase (ER) domain-containing protein n=1 Tax=Rhodotorula graminis (strain WP1) TaxID=578459 RepID=A0A194S857_RHOGW|nr:uncharacterized protein RHOBADRAFT_44098 [Rhodotorula graminis WP1]KPV75591.1 hypothetical protein RHOBADRAFT_44098 [Rhodotorula graminis WP1]
MRAWAYKTKGKTSDVLRLEPSWPKPTPSSSQVLVKVAAAGVNPFDGKAMGVAPVKYMAKAPAVPGLDLSGWVEGGDLSGTGLAIGDEVFGFVSTQDICKTGKGALAEYVAVEKDTLAKKPANVSLEEATTFPLSVLTAYWALVTTAKLQKGQKKRIFIMRPLPLSRNGGSGGVGSYAVQFAKAYGAFVVTTCSPGTLELVSTLGADDILDYRASPLPGQLKAKYGNEPFDIVFDTVGSPEVWRKCPKYLKSDGIYVDVAGAHMDGGIGPLLSGMLDMMGRNLRPGFLGGVPRKYVFGLSTADRKSFAEVEELVRTGKIRPIVDSVFPFDEALKAYERQMSGRAQGKIVVRVHL